MKVELQKVRDEVRIGSENRLKPRLQRTRMGISWVRNVGLRPGKREVLAVGLLGSLRGGDLDERSDVDIDWEKVFSLKRAKRVAFSLGG